MNSKCALRNVGKMKITLFVCAAAVLHFCVVSVNAKGEVPKRSRLLQALENHCGCVDYACGCCQSLRPAPAVDGTLCFNATILVQDYGVSLTVTYNNHSVFNETVSARDPPPTCIVGTILTLLQFCIRLHNVHVTDGKFYVCPDIEVALIGGFPQLAKMKLSCMELDTPFNISQNKDSNIVDAIVSGIEVIPNVLVI